MPQPSSGLATSPLPLPALAKQRTGGCKEGNVGKQRTWARDIRQCGLEKRHDTGNQKKKKSPWKQGPQNIELLHRKRAQPTISWSSTTGAKACIGLMCSPWGTWATWAIWYGDGASIMPPATRGCPSKAGPPRGATGVPMAVPSGIGHSCPGMGCPGIGMPFAGCTAKIDWVLSRRTAFGTAFAAAASSALRFLSVECSSSLPHAQPSFSKVPF